MKQYAELYKLKDNAKDRLRGKYRDMVLGCFLFFLLTVAGVLLTVTGVFLILNFPTLLSALMTGTFAFHASYAGSVLTGLIFCHILAGFFRLGITYPCFWIACGQPCQYDNIFYGFSREFLPKTLLLSVLRLLIRMLFQLPFLYLVIRFAGAMDYRMILAALLVYTAGYAVYVPIGLTFDTAFYLLLDFPDRKLGTILHDSLYVIHGHRRRFFLLQLQFLPLYVLCIMSLGIGFLWIYPYAHMTMTLFYLDLMAPKSSDS